MEKFSAAQQALADVGLDPEIIAYPEEVSMMGFINVLMNENKILIDALLEVARQRDARRAV